MSTQDVTGVDCAHDTDRTGTVAAPLPRPDDAPRWDVDHTIDGRRRPQVSGSLDRLLDQLDIEAGIGREWWETTTAGLVITVVSAEPVAAVLAAIAQVLRDGEDPDVIVGAATAKAAIAVAREWLDAGIAADQVSWWLRTGCWKPTTARALTDVGLRPWRLLDDNGLPRHWIDVGTPDSQRLPLARAVAEDFLTVQSALRVVTRRDPSWPTVRARP